MTDTAAATITRLRIVTATRSPQAEFLERAALGRSLTIFANDERVEVDVFADNTTSLPQLYNTVIDEAPDDAAIVFVHDDVFLLDYFFVDRVLEALHHFDVVGLAGARQRSPRQLAWHLNWDGNRWVNLGPGDLSGWVAHGTTAPGALMRAGPTPAACELLDGVLLAASARTLREHNVRFDPRFAFHFYDLDFCRTARAAGLTLGTWPIAVQHESGGTYGSPAWRNAAAVYLEKWPD